MSPQARIAKLAVAHADQVRLATEQFKVVKNREQYIAQLETAIEHLREAGGPVRSRVDIGDMYAQLRLAVFKVLFRQSLHPDPFSDLQHKGGSSRLVLEPSATAVRGTE